MFTEISWNALEEEFSSLGIPFTRTETLAIWLQKHAQTWIAPSLQYVKGVYQSPNVSLSQESELLHGTFGTLFQVRRITNDENTLVYLKAPKAGRRGSLHMEGVLQAVARAILRAYGFSYAVPRVLDIVRHPIHGVCLTFEKTPNARMLKDYFHTHIRWGVQTVENDRVFVSLLAQLAVYMYILEHEIGFNHRDLTGQNILMIAPCIREQRIILLGTQKWSLVLEHKVMMIDFGFACIGDSDGHTRVYAGAWGHNEFCPKQGRDLFLFLGSLWSSPALRTCVTPRFASLISSWLQTSQKNWATWLESVNERIQSIHYYTDRADFSHTATTPLAILKDLGKHYPECIRTAE